MGEAPIVGKPAGGRSPPALPFGPRHSPWFCRRFTPESTPIERRHPSSSKPSPQKVFTPLLEIP